MSEQEEVRKSRAEALTASPLPLARLREEYRTSLKTLLARIGGPTVLVLDPSLAGPLGLLVESSELKAWGAEAWYVLDDYDINPAEVAQPRTATASAAAECVLRPVHLVFLTRPEVSLMPYIARQVRFGAACRDTQPRRYVLAFVPRQTEECMAALLRHLGPDLEPLMGTGEIQVCRCSMYMFPFDSDVLSMELPAVYRKFHAHADPAPLVMCAEAIMQLQTVLGGLLPRVWAVGNAAKFICDQLLRYRRELQMQMPRTKTLAPQTPPTSPLTVDRTAGSPAVPPFHLFVPVTPEELHGTRKTAAAIGDSDGDDTAVCEDGLPPESQIYTPPPPFHRFAELVDDLILLDRRVDLVTPFSTPFTYEALVDLLIGIRHTYIVPPSTTAGASGAAEPATTSCVPDGASKQTGGAADKARVVLNSSDPVFKEIRNLPQSKVGALLHQKAASIQKTYQEKEKLQSISEISQFMKKFKVKQQEHTSVALHVDLLTAVSTILKSTEFQELLKLEDDIMSVAGNPSAATSSVQQVLGELEDLVDSTPDGAPTEVYRLLCLLSVIGNGIKPKFLDSMRRALTQMFGVEEIHRLHLLESCGLITSLQGTTKSRWPEIKSTLHLIQEEAGLTADDMAYVCAGYAPLSARLIESLYRKPGGWRAVPRLFDILWGPTLEARQRLLVPNTEQQQETEAPDTQNGGGGTRVTIIFYIGGCTYAEVAALRHLEKLEGGRRQFVVITTEMINYKSFIESFAPLTV